MLQEHDPPIHPLRAVARTLGMVALCVLLVGLIGLAVALLSPARDSVLRVWWR
jgi:hypothetical protein